MKIHHQPFKKGFGTRLKTDFSEFLEIQIEILALKLQRHFYIQELSYYESNIDNIKEEDSLYKINQKFIGVIHESGIKYQQNIEAAINKLYIEEL